MVFTTYLRRLTGLQSISILMCILRSFPQNPAGNDPPGYFFAFSQGFPVFELFFYGHNMIFFGSGTRDAGLKPLAL
jgi:hypothetical protein